jgi:hypothetical protein
MPFPMFLLIAQLVAELFSSNCGISYFYTACRIGKLSRGSILGYTILTCFTVDCTVSCMCFASIFVVRPILMTMAASRAMRCNHLPDGSIQWLLVKPRMCFMRQCALHLTPPHPRGDLNCQQFACIFSHCQFQSFTETQG